MISPAIRQETVIFLLAALHGIFLALGYDVLRGLRSAVPHDGFAVSIEDFFYWIIAGFLTFLMAFSVSEGVLRGYAAAAMALGALLYLETVSRAVQKLAARFFCFFYFLLRKAARLTVRVLLAVKHLLICCAGKSRNRFAAKIHGKEQKRIEIKKKKRYNKKSIEKSARKQKRRVMRKKQQDKEGS